MTEFRMPSLGADMDSGTVLEWLVKPGDTVHRGDIVAVVDTAKAAVEVECFTAGVVEQLLVAEGTAVPVGTPLALIGGAAADNGGPGVPAPVVSPPPMPPAVPPAIAPPRVPAAEHVHSPLVRRLAATRGVDLESVTGTGPGGWITRDDVEQAAVARREPASVRARISPYARRLAAELAVDLKALTPKSSDGVLHAADVRAEASRAATDQPVDRQLAFRQAIAALMARSKREIPHYYLTTTVDLSRSLAWLHERNRELPLTHRLVPAALMLKATALAARKVPALNGFWLEDRFVAAEAVHLGVAVSLRDGGLLAPAIHDAADLPLEELMAALRDLVARARAGRLRGSQLSDPTLTVTNLGEQGVESVLGVIYPPQVAVVGFGKVVERPHAVDGLLGVRPVVTLTLSGDHRATDGYTGSRFLNTVESLLQQPEEL